MLKEYEAQLVERYKKYYRDYIEFNENPNSCTAGHLQEISWILHTLFGYTDSEVVNLER